MPRTTATVETLTAEVRVLMVGSRQVTLSVWKQLDQVEPEDIEPFGRVSPYHGNLEALDRIFVVGRCVFSGGLVRSQVGKYSTSEYAGSWQVLPLIVLAGLR